VLLVFNGGSHWELVIGLILIAVVLIFPVGITGLLQKLEVSRPVETSGPKPPNQSWSPAISTNPMAASKPLAASISP
jgi:hypothetical protein